jgi:hypothetical protein
MIGDKITVNEKEYVIKKDITFGEYRKINSINNKLSSLSNQFGEETISTLKPEQLSKVAQDFAQTSDEQLHLMIDFLESTIGITQEDIDNMSLTEAVSLFQESFRACTEVKKKSNKISA